MNSTSDDKGGSWPCQLDIKSEGRSELLQFYDHHDQLLQTRFDIPVLPLCNTVVYYFP